MVNETREDRWCNYNWEVNHNNDLMRKLCDYRVIIIERERLEDEDDDNSSVAYTWWDLEVHYEADPLTTHVVNFPFRSASFESDDYETIREAQLSALRIIDADRCKNNFPLCM